MNNNDPVFNNNIKFPELDYFKNISANEEAEDVMINGFILRLPKTSAKLLNPDYQNETDLISKDDLFNKELKDL